LAFRPGFLPTESVEAALPISPTDVLRPSTTSN
jgi:hypothetical protein